MPASDNNLIRQSDKSNTVAHTPGGKSNSMEPGAYLKQGRLLSSCAFVLSVVFAGIAFGGLLAGELVWFVLSILAAAPHLVLSVYVRNLTDARLEIMRLRSAIQRAEGQGT